MTFYIPSSLLILCCCATTIYACRSSKRRSATLLQRQSRLEQAAAKLRLLSVSPSGGLSSGDVAATGSRGRRLTVVAAALVLGVVCWGCAAAADVLERRTLAGTVAAVCYAASTSALAVLLLVAHQSTVASRTAGRNCWRTVSGSWRNWRTSGSVAREDAPSAAAKQVVYSISTSAPPCCRVGTAPAITSADDDDAQTVIDIDRLQVAAERRDCTGSSCSVPASLSAVQLPVSSVSCGECRLCRSATDSSIGDRRLSRTSTRLKDFDDASWSSDEEYLDWCAEGGSWNGEVDVDGCSIHRAPCPSPASACSLKSCDLEARCSESSPNAVVVLRWFG